MNKKEKVKKMRLTRKHLLWLFTLLFVSGTVFFTVEMSSSGLMLARLESQKEELLDQNRNLTDQLIKKSSLRNLEESAESLGFKKGNTILYINDQDPVAAK